MYSQMAERRKMGYLIVPNFYAPKCSKYVESENPTNIHALSYDKCNFNCNYCVFAYRQQETTYRDYDIDVFREKAKELMKKGNSFKFTGGEPTLDPKLLDRLKVLRDLGAIIYVDSNGSNKKVLKQAIDDGLIDVLGISLKGLSKEEAQQNTFVKNAKICWDNVLEIIQYASGNNHVETIVTYVCYSDFTLDKLYLFSSIINEFPDVYLKINNYQPDVRIEKNGLKPMEKEKLTELVKHFLKKEPEWIGRTILITGAGAVRKFSDVRLL